jgi:hypothetical protein
MMQRIGPKEDPGKKQAQRQAKKFPREKNVSNNNNPPKVLCHHQIEQGQSLHPFTSACRNSMRSCNSVEDACSGSNGRLEVAGR